jgi:hypothetical protein
MSRAVRRVPANWEHPRDEHGRYRPMFDRDFASAAAEWDRTLARRQQSEHVRSRINGFLRGLVAHRTRRLGRTEHGHAARRAHVRR